MSFLRRSARHRLSAGKGSSGFTLVELIIVVMLMGMITSALAASFVTALNASSVDSQRINETDDAQQVASFLVRDAQAAGGSNPATGSADTSLGVSLTDDAGCTGTGALVIRFEWLDRVTALSSRSRVVTYFFDSTAHRLVRLSCVDGGAASSVTLAGSVGSPAPSAGCIPVESCPGLPDRVTLTLTATNNPSTAPSPYTTTLTASVRPEAQVPPNLGNSTSVPLLALGSGGTCTGIGSGLDIGGGPDVVVNGVAAINMSDGSECTALTMTGGGTYTATSTSVLAGGSCTGYACFESAPLSALSTPFADPFAGLPTPTGSCSGSNPAPVSGHYRPGTYPQLLTISTPFIFDAGVYVLCNGMLVNSIGKVSGSGVMLYLKGGGLSIGNGGSVALSAPTTGAYANLLVWLPASNPSTGVTIDGAAVVSTYGGAIYAPNATVSMGNGSGVSVGMVVAKIVHISGGGTATFGVAPPVILAPTTLPDWTVGRPYPSRTFSGSGGYPAYTWSAAGLPAGLSLSSDGTLSGTPTAAGSASTTVTLTDSRGNVTTTSYTYTINAVPNVTTASLPSASQGVAYSATVAATGGTGSPTWSATGLPAGLAINASTGVISGTTATKATASVTVTVTDTAGATDSQALSLAVNVVPFTVTNVMLAPGNGQVGLDDTVTITYNKAIAVATMCSVWSGDTTDQHINGDNQVTVTVNNNAGSTGNDTLTVTSTTCTLRFGTIDLGSPSWVTATRTFKGTKTNMSVVGYDASAFTLVVTLGSPSGATATGIPAQTIVYTPNPALTDTFANAISGSYSFTNRKF